MVERLSNPASLVPSSMSGGNTLDDSHKFTMTGPGSPSVNPIPDKLDVLPLPQWTNDTPIPVSNMAKSGRVPAPQGPGTGTGPPLHTPITAPTPPGGRDTQPYNPLGGKWKEL
jgi:hypothetical protein